MPLPHVGPQPKQGPREPGDTGWTGPLGACFGCVLPPRKPGAHLLWLQATHFGAPSPEQAEDPGWHQGQSVCTEPSRILQASLWNGSPGGRSKRWNKPEEIVYLQRCSDRREAPRRRGQHLATKRSSSSSCLAEGGWHCGQLRGPSQSQGESRVAGRRLSLGVLPSRPHALPCLLTEE